jgi:hypothetical protein
MLLGSVAESVMRHAPCPVLVVKSNCAAALDCATVETHAAVAPPTTHCAPAALTTAEEFCQRR